MKNKYCIVVISCLVSVAYTYCSELVDSRSQALSTHTIPERRPNTMLHCKPDILKTASPLRGGTVAACSNTMLISSRFSSHCFTGNTFWNSSMEEQVWTFEQECTVWESFIWYAVCYNVGAYFWTLRHGIHKFSQSIQLRNSERN